MNAIIPLFLIACEHPNIKVTDAPMYAESFQDRDLEIQ